MPLRCLAAFRGRAVTRLVDGSPHDGALVYSSRPAGRTATPAALAVLTAEERLVVPMYVTAAARPRSRSRRAQAARRSAALSDDRDGVEVENRVAVQLDRAARRVAAESGVPRPRSGERPVAAQIVAFAPAPLRGGLLPENRDDPTEKVRVREEGNATIEIRRRTPSSPLTVSR